MKQPLFTAYVISGRGKGEKSMESAPYLCGGLNGTGIGSEEVLVLLTWIVDSCDGEHLLSSEFSLTFDEATILQDQKCEVLTHPNMHTSYLSILVHHRIVEDCKRTPKSA